MAGKNTETKPVLMCITPSAGTEVVMEPPGPHGRKHVLNRLFVVHPSNQQGFLSQTMSQINPTYPVLHRPLPINRG